MSAAAELVAELESRGVELSAKGETLHYRAPKGVLTADLKDRLRARKPEVLQLLRSDAPDVAAGPVLETREALVAVRVRSRSLGREVWLARDEETARELFVQLNEAESPSEPPLPILLYDEIHLLQGKSVAMLNALLDARAVFPEARVEQ